VEGIPAVIVGITTWLYMTDLPSQAGWLDPDEWAGLIQTNGNMLVNELQSELQAKKALRNYTITETFCDRRILILIAAYFLALTGAVE
jgi:MFS transporter, ACS family, tartrate transporter